MHTSALGSCWQYSSSRPVALGHLELGALGPKAYLVVASCCFAFEPVAEVVSAVAFADLPSDLHPCSFRPCSIPDGSFLSGGILVLNLSVHLSCYASGVFQRYSSARSWPRSVE